MYSFRKSFLFCALLFCAVLSAACNTSQQALTSNLTHAHNLSAAARLSWNPQTHVLTVDVAAAGLAPNSTHPEHIHGGTCASNPMGPIIFTLQDLHANADGIAHSATRINNVQQGIQASGWYINIHNGPTLATPAEAKPIACGNVVNRTNAHRLIVTLTAL